MQGLSMNILEGFLQKILDTVHIAEIAEIVQLLTDSWQV